MDRGDWLLMFACYVLAAAIVAMIVYIEKDVEMKRESGEIVDDVDKIDEEVGEDTEDVNEEVGNVDEEVGNVDEDIGEDTDDAEESESLQDNTKEEVEDDAPILEQLNITIKDRDGDDKAGVSMGRGTRVKENRFKEVDDSDIAIQSVGDGNIYEITNKTPEVTPILLGNIDLEPGDNCRVTVSVINKQRNGDRTTTSIALVSDKGIPLYWVGEH